MKEKITLKEFWESKKHLAIHCKTENEAKTLCEAFHRMGQRWLSGDSYAKKTNWDDYSKNTLYMNDNSFGDTEGYFSRNWCEKIYEFEDILDFADQSITITRHGNKVVAQWGSKVGVAKCSPEDEFDFEFGAKLAFDRLMAKEEKVEPVQEKPVFKPYLEGLLLDRPIIGEETTLTDLLGRKLYVGDVVQVVDSDGNSWNAFIAKDSRGGFVMGCAWSTYNMKKGKDKDGWTYYKVKSYEDLEHLENHSSLTAILKDESPVKEKPVKELYLYNNNGERRGKVGTPTNLTDENGDVLYVGDNLTTKGFRHNVVVENEGEFFIYGWKSVSKNMKNGRVDGDTVFQKIGSYKDLKAGQHIDSLTVKEE